MGPASVDIAHETIENGAGRPALFCRGEFDLATSNQIQNAATQVLPLVPTDGLVIDLTEVTFADSRAIAALLTVRKMLDDRPVLLRGPNPRLRASLELLSVTSLFTIEEPAAEHGDQTLADSSS